MSALGLFGELHREGGLRIVTRDAQARPVAQSVLYPDGDLTCTVRPDISAAQQARHLAAVQAQCDALRRARGRMAAFLGSIGTAVSAVGAGLAIDQAWVSGSGAAGVAALGVVAWRFHRKHRAGR